MSAGFGFSVGDFIAALKIVAEVIDALRESGESSTECRQLLRRLFDLETALIHVKRLELDDSQLDQENALKHAALQCRNTIDRFMRKIQKYQPYLRTEIGLEGSRLKSSWYRIKWALCRKEDIERFKADITGHTEGINILMNAIQIQKLTLDARSQDQRHSSLKGLVQDCFAKTMQKLVTIADSITVSLANSKHILEIIAQTAQTDCKIFSIVLDMQDLLRKTIAPQVLRQQPVYFVDALGIPAPFYLEFIRSKDAFVSVLRHNLEGNDAAVRRIDRGEFAVSDIATKTDINLRRPWNMCFRPGQQVDMSMILSEQNVSSSTCPSCKTGCTGEVNSDIECTKCGLTFRRLTELEDDGIVLSQTPNEISIVSADKAKNLFGPQIPPKKRKREAELNEELVLYRKVRLRLHATTSNAATDLLEIVQDSDEAKSPTTVTFDEAIDLVDRIKARYASRPVYYKMFLDILRDYQAQKYSLLEVWRWIQRLFGDQPDLMENFKRFLPNVSQEETIPMDEVEFFDKLKAYTSPAATRDEVEFPSELGPHLTSP